MASLAYAIQLIFIIALTASVSPLPRTLARYFTLMLAKDTPPPAKPAAAVPEPSVAQIAWPATRVLDDVSPRATHCETCGRALNEDAHPLSKDCGDGRCWGCVGQIEASIGNRDAQQAVDAEIKAGLRNADASPAS